MATASGGFGAAQHTRTRARTHTHTRGAVQPGQPVACRGFGGSLKLLVSVSRPRAFVSFPIDCRGFDGSRRLPARRRNTRTGCRCCARVRVCVCVRACVRVFVCVCAISDCWSRQTEDGVPLLHTPPGPHDAEEEALKARRGAEGRGGGSGTWGDTRGPQGAKGGGEGGGGRGETGGRNKDTRALDTSGPQGAKGGGGEGRQRLVGRGEERR